MGSLDSCLLKEGCTNYEEVVCEVVIFLLVTAAVMTCHFQEGFQCFSLNSVSSYSCEDAE